MLNANLIAALATARDQGFFGGPMNGVDPPGLGAGMIIFPPNLMPVTNTTTLTATAARYYIAPFWFNGRQAIAGATFSNSGTGDNGKKVKIALYNATNSGPGSLAKSFGEITLNGSALIRQLASAYVPPRGWYWGEFVCDGAGAFHGMAAVRIVSSLGSSDVGEPYGPLLGMDTTTFGLAENTGARNIGSYVGGTYANFPEATSLVPATSVQGGTGNLFPAFGFYT